MLNMLLSISLCWVMGLKLYFIFGIAGIIALWPFFPATFKLLVKQGKYNHIKDAEQSPSVYKAFLIMSCIEILLITWPANLINLIIDCFERKDNDDAV